MILRFLILLILFNHLIVLFYLNIDLKLLFSFLLFRKYWESIYLFPWSDPILIENVQK